MAFPSISEVPEFYQNYVKSLPKEPLIQLLRNIQDQFNLLGKLSNSEAEYRYAENKWSVKEITGHLIDTERIFCNRALRFARKDFTELPGFDQNIYVENGRAHERDWGALLNEFDSVRSATIYLFESFSEDQLLLKGKANQVEMSVNTIGFITVGHQMHHLKIIRERYIKS